MHLIQAKGILSAKNGMNLYRGCTHGCIYCDSRSKCYNMEHDFEDVAVKINGPELLESALKRKRKKCMIGTGAMGDPYLHLEKKLRLTRQCLELINNHGFGLAIQTKSTRILEDLDLLLNINHKTKCVVQMTLTTFDENLCKVIEPHVSTTKERFKALQTFQEQGIPTVVWLSPLLPLINDHEENLREILDYCAEAKVQGIICFGMGLTLREGNREYFFQKLDEHFPGLKDEYRKRYGNSYNIISPYNNRLMKIFRETCQKRGIMFEIDDCFSYLHAFTKKTNKQLILPGFGSPDLM